MLRVAAATLFLLAGLSAPVTGEEVKADYLYNLSDFTGVVPYNWVRLAADRQRNEVYVTNPSDLTVRIYNNNGMQVYNFGGDGELGFIKDLALDENGNMFVLAGLGREYTVIRANYRGEQTGKVTFANLPQEFAEGFSPDRLLCREGALYLADRVAMKVLVTDLQGSFRESYDLGTILGLDEKKKRDSGIVGFSVDPDGNLLVTIPVFFSVYVVSPDRKVRSFGVAGSSPGKFNIIGGIAADDKGYLYVADTLRCVVMIFAGKDFSLKGEFGYRGFDQGNLIAPLDLLAVGDRVYVTQSRNRGVSVYRMTVQ